MKEEKCPKCKTKLQKTNRSTLGIFRKSRPYLYCKKCKVDVLI